jgi:hypothetical protein
MLVVTDVPEGPAQDQARHTAHLRKHPEQTVSYM